MQPPQKDSPSQSASSTAESQIYLNGKRLSLATSCTVSRNTHPDHAGLFFVTSPCEVVENQLRKYFSITYKDTVIFVEDKITLEGEVRNFQNKQAVQKGTNEASSSRTRTLKKKRKNKKMILFKYNSLKNAEISDKTDKKNVVKNVVSAFVKSLKEGKLGQEGVQGVIETIQKLIEAKKYNNRLITGLVQQRAVREYFKRFLSLEAGNWVENSKVKAKQFYKSALELYESLCGEYQKKEEKRKSSSDTEKRNEIDLRQLENYDLEEEIRGFK